MDQALKDVQSNIFVPFYDTEEHRNYNSTSQVPYTVLGVYNDQLLFNCYAERVESGLTKNAEFFVTKRPGISLPIDTAENLQSNWDGAFTNTNRCVKDHIVSAQVPDSMVAAVIDDVAGSGPYTGSLKIVIYQPAQGTVVAFNLSGASFLNAAIDTRDWVFLNEFAAGTSIAGTPTATTPYITVVWTKYDKSDSRAFHLAYSSGGGWAGSTMTMITNTAFPTHYTGNLKEIIGNFAMLGGRAHIMTTDGYIFSSKVGDMSNATGWAGNAFTNAISYPDGGLGVLRYKHHVVAFGTDSVEFFNDSGDEAGSPLITTEQAFIKFGTMNPKAFINVEDTLYWLGSGSSGLNGLWKLEGYTPVKVSSSSWDRLLVNAPDYSFVSGFWRSIQLKPFTMNGKKMLGIGGVYIRTSDKWRFMEIDYRTNVESTLTDTIRGNTAASSGLPVYNTTDQTWWVLSPGYFGLTNNSLSGDQFFQLFPAMRVDSYINEYSGTALYLSPHRQYWLGIGGTDIMQVSDSYIVDRQYKDYGTNGTTDAHYWIPVLLETNPVRFDTMARKTLQRVTLLADRQYAHTAVVSAGMVSWDSDDTNWMFNQAVLDAEYTKTKIFLGWSDTGGRTLGSMYSRSSMNPNPADSTTTSVTNAMTYQYRTFNWDDSRFVFRRLGTFRERSFVFVIWTPFDFRAKGFEMTVTQGAS